MAITITYRFMGVDVTSSAPHIDYIQWDSDIAVFNKDTSTVDVVWNGVLTHYAPYTNGGPPNVTYYTQYRLSVSNTDGAVSDLIAHTSAGDIYAAGAAGVLVSVTPTGASNPFSPAATTFGPLAADLQNVSTASFGTTAVLTPGTRGIAIDVPTVGQWALQKLSVRPRPEDRE
jgi:hypothetical protein